MKICNVEVPEPTSIDKGMYTIRSDRMIVDTKKFITYGWKRMSIKDFVQLYNECNYLTGKYFKHDSNLMFVAKLDYDGRTVESSFYENVMLDIREV